MKKVILLILVIFSFNMTLNAECDYKEKVNLITLSSYVDYNYEYMNDNTFKLTLYNVTEEMQVIYNNIEYPTVSNIVEIFSLEEGKNIRLTIKASSISQCESYDLRVISLTIPYVNPYYESNRCIGFETLNVCSNKFLQYKISETEFLRLIEKTDNENKQNEEVIDKEPVVEQLSIYEKALKLVKKIWIPVVLVIVTSGVTLAIYSTIYRKIKHGL